jgi:hypothetical protein
MENTEKLPQIKVDNELLIKRQTAWAGLGKVVYETELVLQAIAQEAKQSVNIPTKIEDVLESEAKIKQLKKVQNDLIERRKSITSKFDVKTQDLMKAEKSIDEPIKLLTDACISLKSVEQKRVRSEQEKQNEIKNIREVIINALTGIEANYKNKIELSVNKCYEAALIESNIKPADIEKYIIEVEGKIKTEHFQFTLPQITTTLSDVEFSKITGECFETAKKPSDYVQLYKAKLNDKFAFYEIAYNDKASAIEKSKTEEVAKLKAIETEKINKEVAVKLESIAIQPTVQKAVLKELKKSYEVDLEETKENAMLIIAAFVANYEVCINKVRVKPFNLSVGQMAKVLADLKSENNDFEVSNIKFREIEKL